MLPLAGLPLDNDFGKTLSGRHFARLPIRHRITARPLSPASVRIKNPPELKTPSPKGVLGVLVVFTDPLGNTSEAGLANSPALGLSLRSTLGQ